MGMRVQQFEDIVWALESVPKEGSVFCFFAFDERPSHRDVLDFLTDSSYWIDSLSANAGIRTLFFSEKWSDIAHPPGWMYQESQLSAEEDDFLDTLEKKTMYINPTLELAKRFGIKPSSLPGLIIFDALPENAPVHSLYIPLNLSLFSQGNESSESTLAEIYSSIGEAIDKNRGENIAQVFASIEQSLSTIGKAPQPLTGMKEKLTDFLDEFDEKVEIKRYSKKNIVPFVSRAQAHDIRIFISYAREDEFLADRMYKRFREAGFQPWMDRRDILPGEKWDVAIRKALRNADFFLAIISKNSVRKRGYVQREFREALEMWKEKLDNDIYLIPVRFYGADVPDSFQQFQWIDFDSQLWGRSRGDGRR